VTDRTRSETEDAARALPDAPEGPIAYIVKMFPRLSETFIVNEVSELRRRGVDLRVISLLPPVGSHHSREALRLAEATFYLPSASDRAGIRSLLRDHRFLMSRAPRRYLHALWYVARRFSPSAWKRFLQAGGVARYCLQENVSHVHAGFAHVPASVAFWVQRLTGIPYSFAAHAKDLYLSAPRSLRHKMDAARFVWTCTRANAEYLRSLGGLTPIHVGYHGVDLDSFAPPPQGSRGNDQKASILAVGRLVPKKGLDDLLRAGGILEEHGVAYEITIVGDGPERGRLMRLAAELGMNGRVRFRGSLPPEKVLEEYARADVFVLPSVVLPNGDRDGIPNVLVEAMAMGVPVISSRISAIPELVQDGVTGTLVEPRNPADLAAAVERVLANPGGAREASLRARHDVVERFDVRRNSETLGELLQRHRKATRCIYVSADLGVPVRGHKGASAHVRQIAQRLGEEGIAVRIVTPAPGPEPPEGNPCETPIDLVSPPGWITRLADSSKNPRTKGLLREYRRLLLNVPMGRRMGALLRGVRPDFVYERYALCSFGAGWACRRRGVPWLLEVNAPLAEEEARHRDLRLRWLTRRIERWILRHADHVFVVSHALRRWAMENGVHPDRVSVLPNGVDTRRFHPGVDGSQERSAWGWSEQETVVAFAGSMKSWHGGLLLLDAFERAQRQAPGLRLVYIGDGPERKAIEKRARKHGIDAHVRFTGNVPQDRVPRLLRAADVLVAPYLPEQGFYFSPLKVLEYMAVGRAIVASRIGELPDLLGPARARLVPPGDRSSLSEALSNLASDPALRRRMGKAAAAAAPGEDWTDRARRILTTARGLGALRREPPARVAYVLKMFPRFSETFVVNEITELERQGLDIRVFSMKLPAGKRQDEADRVRALVSILPSGPRLFRPGVVGAHLACLLRRPRSYFGALWFALGRRDHRALTKFGQAGVIALRCRREGVRHLHAHFASGPTRVAKMTSMISGIPFSFTAHAKDLYWKGHHHAESHKLKKRVKLARFVVAVSQENKRFIESMGFRVKEGRIRSVYIGLRLDEFAFLPPSARPRTPRPLILGVGRLVEKKGFQILIDALAILRDRGRGFRCLIVGEGPERSNLEARILANGLERDVRMLGAVSFSRLRQRYYNRARVLSLPCMVAADGDRDGIPTVLLEAMALGVPVVTTRVSGIPEAMDDDVEGLLAEPGNAKEIADRIDAVLADSSFADRIALAARNRVEVQFDLRRNAGALRKLFLRSIDGWQPLSMIEPAVESGDEYAVSPSNDAAGAVL
jgi:glycosyltransferase involved in cell wall biosynthesis